MDEITALTAQGPWVFVAVLASIACIALWRQNNRLNDIVREQSQQSAREYRETLTKMLEHNAATQLALQVNAQTISALERAIANLGGQR